MGTVAENEEIAIEAHCLIQADTVTHGKNHESKHPKRVIEKVAQPVSAANREARKNLSH